ncbi:MAG: hypothetical protein L3K16_02355 [Thermoplasmata archaeon]|nr:hypothetical protein [Thermoplasmata archaeon]
MRRGVALAIVFVAVLIASSFAALPGAMAAPTSTARTVVHPAATDTISSRNSGGGGESYYYTELGDNNVYFYATDAADATATVAINDYNASRDGLTNPVATTSAHFTAGANSSWTSGTYLSIPLTVVYPGTWNITINGGTAGFAFENFTVESYYVSTGENQTLALPGHQVSYFYQVLSDQNDAPYSHVTSVWADGWYWTNASTFAQLPGLPATLPGDQAGFFNFTLPTNASGDASDGYAYVYFYANTTGSSVWSYDEDAYNYIAELDAPVVQLGSCAGACYTDEFSAGQTIVATASEWMSSPYYTGDRAPAPGIDLNIRYLKGTTAVTPTGNPPTRLVTNQNGIVQWLFTADASAFSTTGSNILNVTTSDPQAPTNTAPGTNYTFYVAKAGGVIPDLQITFGLAQYYGGDTIFANWTLTGNASVTNGWNATYWWGEFYVEGSDFDTVFDQGPASGTSGEITVVAPLGLTATIYFYVDYSNATRSDEGENNVPVSPPQILMTPSEEYYLPGDSVTVTVTTLGSVLSSATLQALVVDSSGDRLISGPLSGSTLTVSIPLKAAPEDVEFSVFAVDSTGAVISNGTVYVDLAVGYDLTVGVVTKSNYADDSFQPGQTVQFSYSITARGYVAMPKAWTIWVWPAGSEDNTGLGAVEIQTTSSSGTISYTIPSGSPNGIQTFEVEAEPSSEEYGAYNAVSINVESNPSGLGLELGAGSGLTVGWLILLIVILVIAVVLFLVIRSQGRPKMMRPESGSPPPSGGSPPPQAWQEPPPAAGGTPPPTPPSGST